MTTTRLFLTASIISCRCPTHGNSLVGTCWNARANNRQCNHVDCITLGIFSAPFCARRRWWRLRSRLAKFLRSLSQSRDWGFISNARRLRLQVTRTISEQKCEEARTLHQWNAKTYTDLHICICPCENHDIHESSLIK